MMMLALYVMLEGLLQRMPTTGYKKATIDRLSPCILINNRPTTTWSGGQWQLPHLKLEPDQHGICQFWFPEGRVYSKHQITRAAGTNWTLLKKAIEAEPTRIATRLRQSILTISAGSLTTITNQVPINQHLRNYTVLNPPPSSLPTDLFSFLLVSNGLSNNVEPDTDDPVINNVTTQAGLRKELRYIFAKFGHDILIKVPQNRKGNSDYVNSAFRAGQVSISIRLLMDADNIKDIFLICSARKAQTAWDIAFKHLFPTTFDPSKKLGQGYAQCSYWPRWRRLIDAAVGQEETKMLEKATKAEFARLSWCVAAVKDRLWETKMWGKGGMVGPRLVLNPKKNVATFVLKPE